VGEDVNRHAVRARRVRGLEVRRRPAEAVPKKDGPDRISYEKKLVMPWNFGVYREGENDIENQEVLCETSTLTGPEVWQRIWNFPIRKSCMSRS